VKHLEGQFVSDLSGAFSSDSFFFIHLLHFRQCVLMPGDTAVLSIELQNGAAQYERYSSHQPRLQRHRHDQANRQGHSLLQDQGCK
jgi:hypothetical protein